MCYLCRCVASHCHAGTTRVSECVTQVCVENVLVQRTVPVHVARAVSAHTHARIHTHLPVYCSALLMCVCVCQSVHYHVQLTFLLVVTPVKRNWTVAYTPAQCAAIEDPVRPAARYTHAHTSAHVVTLSLNFCGLSSVPGFTNRGHVMKFCVCRRWRSSVGVGATPSACPAIRSICVSLNALKCAAATDTSAKGR